MRKRVIAGFLLVLAISLGADEQLRVTTWNIEHLGTDGRGFGGGYGGDFHGNIPRRSDEQLRELGRFIRDDLGSDLVAVQEIGISHGIGSRSRSRELDVICSAMGEEWDYYLPPVREDHNSDSMYVGYVWDSSRVRALSLRPMDLPNIDLAGKALFDRIPVLGYFEVTGDDGNGNDFLVINVHLASGQDHDENHLIAMTLLEYEIKYALKGLRVTESDRIILGDFNDNPYAVYESGSPKYTDALYRHMENKGYQNYVTADFETTRMNYGLSSVIDHVLINSSARRHVIQSESAQIFLPPGGVSSYAEWRQTYSDHFPISVDLRIGRDDDADWQD